MVIKISTKLVYQILIALAITSFILFKVHDNGSAGFRATSNSSGNIQVVCPLPETFYHYFDIVRNPKTGIMFPDYKLLYFKSGISHWGYLIIGTIILTLFFQIKFEFELLNELKEFITNGKRSRALEFLFVLIAFLSVLYFLYTQKDRF